MKIIELNQKSTTQPGPSRRQNKRKSRRLAMQSDPTEPWEYQGKRRDQVESSYKIFAFSILTALIIMLISLLMSL